MREEKKLQIPIITNIQLEPFLGRDLKRAFGAGTQMQIMQLSCEEVCAGHNSARIMDADIVVVLLDYDSFFSEKAGDIYNKRISEFDLESGITDLCLQLYHVIRKINESPIFWFSFEDYCDRFKYVSGSLYTGIADRININLQRSLEKQTIIIDMKRLVAVVGIRNAYDSRLKYRWNCPYSLEMIKRIADEIYKQYNVLMNITPKCLVLDCDNTLWGGILSEDGIGGIKIGTMGIGSIYSTFQRFLVHLYMHGVILAICSKNDMYDVMRVFEEHSGMLLKKEHIAYFCVNWENKVNNIIQISEELNISLSSMVFVDDSEFEVEAVRKIIPEVQAFVFDRDKIYHDLSCFNFGEGYDIKTVKSRIETYRSNQDRELLRMGCDSFADFLAALGMEIRIESAKESELKRISELSQRTNKCTNGTRYHLAELSEIMKAEKYLLYTVYLKDRYSDLGIIGAFGITHEKLDLFCVSCRALGRNIEDEILKNISEQYGDIIYQFKMTDQNKWLKNKFDLYLREGSENEDNFTN